MNQNGQGVKLCCESEWAGGIRNGPEVKFCCESEWAEGKVLLWIGMGRR